MIGGAFVFLAAASAQACDERSSKHATVQQIATSPQDFVGYCVIISAYSDGRSLFDSRKALQEHLRLKSMKLSGMRLADEMIGVYGLPEVSEAVRLRQRTSGIRWRLMGRVDTCAEMQRRAQKDADVHHPPGIILISMMAGHCHYLGGPVLRVTEGQTLLQNGNR